MSVKSAKKGFLSICVSVGQIKVVRERKGILGKWGKMCEDLQVVSMLSPIILLFKSFHSSPILPSLKLHKFKFEFGANFTPFGNEQIPCFWQKG